MNSNGQEWRALGGPPESIRPGKTVAGKYLLESPLGSGAMGTVWIATHQTLGSKVAVKMVSPDFAGTFETQSRFLAEAKAAASLRSRYVVQMFDSGVTEEGAPYIVMEYLRGESLEDRLQRLGRLPMEPAVRILGQVAKGLERAHARNIVHRDLKPANIFLSLTEDGEEVAKILDFGIAKIDHDDKDYKATATGVIMGTPLFMSPEQARGLKTVDHTSDLYSLGMVTYAMLVGDVPFHAESFGDLVYMVCTQDLPDVVQLAPWLPSTMDAWFRKACAKDQKQRFASAEHMYQALIVASQLSRPSLELSAFADSVTAGSDVPGNQARRPGAGFGAQTEVPQALLEGARSQGPAAAAPTVPFSSSAGISTPWPSAGGGPGHGAAPGEGHGVAAGEGHGAAPDEGHGAAPGEGGFDPRLEARGDAHSAGMVASATQQSGGTQRVGFADQANTHDGGVVSSGFPASSTKPPPRRAPLWIALAVIALGVGGGLAWWSGREPTVTVDAAPPGDSTAKAAVASPTAPPTVGVAVAQEQQSPHDDATPRSDGRDSVAPESPSSNESAPTAPGDDGTPAAARAGAASSVPRTSVHDKAPATKTPRPIAAPSTIAAPSRRPVAKSKPSTPATPPPASAPPKPARTEPVDLGF